MQLGADFSRTFKLGLTKATLTGSDRLTITNQGQLIFQVQTVSSRVLPLNDFLTFFNYATGNATLTWFAGAAPVKPSTFSGTLGLVAFAAVLQGSFSGTHDAHQTLVCHFDRRSINCRSG